jgi:AcrR family transcriptional regulator
VSLIHEKTYDTIVVKEILARADVGRTAFYAHFRDKDALLASAIQHMLSDRAARVEVPPRPFGNVLRFSLPVLQHVERFRQTAGARMGRKGRFIIHQHLRRMLVDTIADDVRALVRSDSAASAVPADLLADYVVTTFILVLDWWVESGSALSTQQVDDVFLALVGPALARARAR